MLRAEASGANHGRAAAIDFSGLENPTSDRPRPLGNVKEFLHEARTHRALRGQRGLHDGMSTVPPRVEFGTQGIKQLRVPWSEPGSQFTALFERLAIDLLRECSITGGPPAAHQMGRGLGDQGRAVKRGLARRGQEVVGAAGGR